jgi:hypothetical protein
MIDSRKGVNKTNELIINNWKNAFTAIKTAFISQEILDRLRFALNKYDLIRRHKFRNSNFKRYSYTESITFILVKSQKYYAGQE